MPSPPRYAFPRAKPHKFRPFEVKVLVRHRDGYRCTDCGITARQHVRLYGRTLDVHRVAPGSPYTVKGCVTLCRDCHAEKPASPPGTNKHKARLVIRGRVALRLRRVAALTCRTLKATVHLALSDALDRLETRHDLPDIDQAGEG